MKSKPDQSEEEFFNDTEDTPPPYEFKLHMAKKFRDMGLSRDEIKQLIKFMK
jgi:hypothetical protein